MGCTMIILKKSQLEAATLVAPKNDTRAYLNGVLLEVTFQKAVYLVSTDACLLFVGEVDCPDFTVEPKMARLVIPRTAIEQALKVKSQTIELKRLSEGWQLGSVLFASTDGDRYPEWRRVNVSPLDINTGSPEAAQYNPELLLVAHKALNKWNYFSKKSTIVLHQRGNNPGVLVHPMDKSAHCVIMPLRVDTAALPRAVKSF